LASAKSFPGSILLVDTYDTLEGVRRAIELVREQGSAFDVRGIRLDSGDLGARARSASAPRHGGPRPRGDLRERKFR